MNVLLATDNSLGSTLALHEVINRPWPPDTEVRVLSVAHAVPLILEPTLSGIGIHYDSVSHEHKRAAHAVSSAVDELASAAPQLRVTSGVLEGSPSTRIVEEAERWGADLIVLGSHGHGAAMRMLLGSVSHRVMLHARCSVEVVRRPRQEAPGEPTPAFAV